ncbi:hypothetical protein CRG98_046768 [Punica granatum]|uniref:Uncharacterized protein n=1 Tax=Punica granatum TaxID=22663 RepID=A0A2I0HM77_PUNGR|nr:hypothetical protein CRG98_046768 [Punica granatum]
MVLERVMLSRVYARMRMHSHHVRPSMSECSEKERLVLAPYYPSTEEEPCSRSIVEAIGTIDITEPLGIYPSTSIWHPRLGFWPQRVFLSALRSRDPYHTSLSVFVVAPSLELASKPFLVNLDLNDVHVLGELKRPYPHGLDVV